MLNLTNEHIISAKANCFRAGIFDVLDLTAKQVAAMGVLTDGQADELLFGGAAGGGKSYLGCEWLLWNCIAYPGTRWFIGRHHLSQIRESTAVTFRKVCKKHNIPADWWKYNENGVKIMFRNGSTISGLEMMRKPGDPDFDGFGSTEYTGGWIEEGGGVAYKAYEVAGTRIGRHLNDEYGIRGKLLITGNPSRNWMYSTFFKPFRDGSLSEGRAFIQAFVTDNEKREGGYLERLQKLTGAARARLLLGDWEYDADPLSLIEWGAIEDLFTNDYLRPDEKRKRLVVDIALHGSDKFRAGVFYGAVMVEHTEMPKSGGEQVLKHIRALQAKHNIRASAILYDADGVGGFIGKKGGFIPGANAFHGGGTPIKMKDGSEKSYFNLKAQCGYLLADKINEGKLWAKGVTEQTDREMLREELAQVKRDKGDGDGKLRLKPKDQIRADLGRSPDFSDILLMAMWFDLMEATQRTFNRPLQM